MLVQAKCGSVRVEVSASVGDSVSAGVRARLGLHWQDALGVPNPLEQVPDPRVTVRIRVRHVRFPK